MKLKNKLILSLLILIFIMSSFTAWSAPHIPVINNIISTYNPT